MTHRDLSASPSLRTAGTAPRANQRWSVFSIAIAALVVASCLVRPLHAQPSKPNIVFILADDLGIGDTGVTNQNARASQGLASFATPNIDSIALQGARFNNMYTGAPTCAPSRNVMLTGFHQGHTIFDRATLPLDLRGGQEDKTWAQTLQQANYETGFFGKWHLGGVDSGLLSVRDEAALPTNKGFETSYGPMHGTFRQSVHWRNDADGVPSSMEYFVVPKESAAPGAQYMFGDTLVAQQAANFIKAKAQGSQPFAAYVPFMAPHIPINQVPQDHPYVNRVDWTQPQRDYAGMMYYLDQHVGQILAAIDDPNGDGNTADSVASNTIVMFGSDNGALQTNNSTGWSTGFFGSNMSYSGAKALMTEGGIRTPFFVRWNGTITPGTQNNSLIANYGDLMPTFAEIAGQDVPLGIDGKSILSDFIGGPASERPDLQYMSQSIEIGGNQPGGWSVRVGDWKLIKRRPSSTIMETTYRLYNVVTDPNEVNNLADSRTDIRNALEILGIAEGGDREPTGPAANGSGLQEIRNIYFTQYKQWAPQGGSTDFLAAANWAGGTQQAEPTDPEALHWNTAPADNWLAVMSNAPNVAQQIPLSANSSVMAMEIVGNGATMALRVNTGARLTARNGMRISPGGILRLRGGEINTIREIDIRLGGKFDGEGLINGQQAVIAGIAEFANKGLFEPKMVNRGIVTIASDADASFDAGRLLIQGDYQQFSSGVLELSVFSNGGVAGLNYDQLAVTGKAALAGVLSVTATNPTSLPIGAAFQIVTATGGLTGAFTSILGPTLAAGRTWAVDYTSTIATLRVVAGTAQPTDYLSRWRHSFALDSGADLNGDGLTDGDDLLLWQRGVVALPAALSVPEPAAAMLLLTGVAGALSRVRRSRRRARC